MIGPSHILKTPAFDTSGLIKAAKEITKSFSDAYTETTGYGKGAFINYVNNKLLVEQEQPDVNGYTFVFLEPPDLSGFKDKDVQYAINEICRKSLFLAIEATPPSITINTEEVSTQSSVSMPYATTKVATGNLSISFLDNSNMDINSLHNVWIEYIYNQLWGDLLPADKYLDPDQINFFGALDYATSAFIIKYDPSFSDPPVMVGKATGIFPTGLPVKEVIGTRSNRELVMQTVTYTCSYYEVVHPRSMVQIYGTNGNGHSILDEVIGLSDKFKAYNITGTLV